MFNKLDSSEFQQEANSFNIVSQKTQPLKNGGRYENASSKRNEPNRQIDAIEIDFDIPQRIRFTIIMEVFVVINAQYNILEVG